MEWCLQQQNWDIISLQDGGFAAMRTLSTADAIHQREIYLTEELVTLFQSAAHEAVAAVAEEK